MSKMPAAVAVLFSVIGLLLSAAPSGAQYSQGTDPGTVVDVQIEAGRFANPLPFDVQFFIRGPADADVVGVRGRYAKLTRALTTCQQALGDGAAVSLGNAPIFTHAEKGRVFELSARPLSPDEDYCFELTLRIKVDRAELQPLVIQAVDTTLRNLSPRSGDLLTVPEYDAFRRTVVAAIEALRQKKEAEKKIRLTFVPPPGSFFDLKTPAIAVRADYQLQFTNALQGQRQRDSATNNYNTSITRAISALTDFATTTRVSHMVTKLRENDADRLVGTRTSALDGSFALIEAEPAVLNPDLSTWDLNATAAQIQRLQAAVTNLNRISQLVRDIQRLPLLRQAAELDQPAKGAPANPDALTDAELNTIRDDAESVADEIENALGDLERVEDVLGRRSVAIAAMSEQVLGEVEKQVEFTGTTTAGWETRAKSYVSADVGIAWSQPIDSFFFYLGANFYFGPVNKKAPLKWGDGGNFRKRVALLAAIPFNSFESGTNQTVNLTARGVELKGVLGSRPLLLGGGVRLNDLVRVGGGAVLFRVKDPDPLVDQDRIDSSWFISISIDWDVKGMFSTLAGTTPTAPAPQR